MCLRLGDLYNERIFHFSILDAKLKNNAFIQVI